MALAPGTRIGSYEVVSPLGRGGMGEVWRARDTKLGRDVALKALPPEFAADPDRVARFEREARLLASLNHANIGGIHGLEEADGTVALVLELVEGDTLADRLVVGALPADEALRLGVQICTALEAAHEKGVIHRDLKPANIKITPEGTVKVLDFGLAKAFEARETDAALTHSPTLSMAATQAGVILGTAGYMSPEQASGTASDKRADIWSFGVVLFEMLAGAKVFGGETVPHVLAAVLAREPDWASLPPHLHPRLREVLERCLQKKPADRYRDIGDVRADLQRVLADPQGAIVAPVAPAAAEARSGLRASLPWVAATAAICLVVAGAAGWFLRPAPAPEPRPVVRSVHALPEGRAFRNRGRPVLTIAADGQHFVYNGSDGLYLRALDTVADRLIPGTEGNITNPALSPDGQSVVYFDAPDFQLKRITVSGGASLPLTDATNPFGISWEADGTILYGQPDGIWQVSENGSDPQHLITTEAGEQAHGPQRLPGGDWILFTLARTSRATRWDEAEIVVESPATGERRVVLAGGSDARYLPTGHLVYAFEDVLYAVAFDVDRLERRGGQVPVVQGVQRALAPEGNTGAASYSVTADGTLVYVPGTAGVVAEEGVLALVDRAGAVSPLPVRPGQYRSPRVSPDGRQLAVEVLGADGQGHIWLYELSGQSQLRRLTQTGNNTRPIWTPDSERVTFASQQDGAWGIYEQPADGGAVAERLLAVEQGPALPESWSPDGQTLLFTDATTQGEWTVWTLTRDGDQPVIFADEVANHFGAVFSPDGRWVAYTGVDDAAGTGLVGVRVQSFPSTGVVRQVTQDGEVWPLWSADGTELFFRLRRDIALPAQLMGLDVSTAGAFTFRNPRQVPIQGALMFANYRDFDLMPDGERFVMIVPAARTATSPDEPDSPPGARTDVVLNWVEELKARVPVN